MYPGRTMLGGAPRDAARVVRSAAQPLAASKRFATSSQLITFHHASR